MKIYFFSPRDILRPRTDQIYDIQLCEGFAENECSVELISPYEFRKDNIKKNQIFCNYGVKTPFKIKILKTPFWSEMPPKISASILFFINCIMALKIFLINSINPVEIVILSRGIDLLIPSIVLKKILRSRSSPKVILWAHEIILKKRYQWVYRNSDGIIGTNSVIIEDLIQKFRIPKRKLAVSLSPISYSQLKNLISRDKARKKIRINVKKPLIVYTGKLSIKLKEATYILQAALLLPQFQFLLTGGKPDVVTHYKNRCRQLDLSNVTFTGYLWNYNDVRFYQFAADVLISYYSSHDHYVRYNLPSKICEYMLTRNPIVTCDFPATKDILNNSNAIIVKPEDSAALAQGIKQAIENKEKARLIAGQAFDDVKQLTFKNRTEILLGFLRSL